MNPNRQGLGSTLRRLSVALVQHAHTRLELLQSEVADERARLGSLLWRAALSLLATFTAVQLTVLAIVGWVWNTPWRVPVIASIAAVVCAVTFLCWRWLLLASQPSSSLFSASLVELEKDRRTLGGVP